MSLNNYAKKCSCGAVTVYYINEGGQEVNLSMSEEDYNKHFPDLNLEGDEYCNCNYCVNHWGIDLCGCGSGEKVGECENDFDDCRFNIPSQHLEV